MTLRNILWNVIHRIGTLCKKARAVKQILNQGIMRDSSILIKTLGNWRRENITHFAILSEIRNSSIMRDTPSSIDCCSKTLITSSDTSPNAKPLILPNIRSAISTLRMHHSSKPKSNKETKCNVLTWQIVWKRNICDGFGSWGSNTFTSGSLI